MSQMSPVALPRARARTTASTRRPSTEAVITVARTTSSLARDIAEACQFPPAKAAAGLVLLIFETIEGMRNNKEQCMQLAERAATMLLEVKDQMEGRWLDAPESLVRNITKLEDTLRLIHEFMKEEALAKWKDRLLRKRRIEDSIKEYDMMLSDAARSFQITSLIDIHYTLHEAAGLASPDDTLVSSPVDEKNLDCTTYGSMMDSDHKVNVLSSSSYTSHTKLAFIEEVPSEQKEKTDEVYSTSEKIAHPPTTVPPVTPAPPPYFATQAPARTPLANDHGLPRFHQSQIRLKARALKVALGAWHAGATAVQVALPDIPTSLVVYMKRYTGADASERWRADAEMLLSSKNPYMPTLVGLSDDKTPAPFLLVTDRN